MWKIYGKIGFEMRKSI